MSPLFRVPTQMEDLALFTRHVAGAMGARVPLPDMLRAYVQDSEPGPLTRAVGQIADRVESGVELSAAMEEYPRLFPAAYRRLVRLGEQGRVLGPVMDQLAGNLQEGLKTYENFRRAAVYPLMVVILLFADLLFVIWKIMPKFQDIFDQLGGSMGSVFGMQIAGFEFLRAVIVIFALVVLFCLALLVGSAMGLRLRGFGGGRFVLQLPLIGPVLRRAETARFARHLALLLRNRMPVLEALGLLADSSENTYVQRAILDFRDRYESGERLGDLIAGQPLFPAGMATMVAAAEDQGGLAETLDSLGGYYAERTAHGLLILREVFEPIMLLLVGLMVAMTMLAVYGPLFQIPRLVGQ